MPTPGPPAPRTSASARAAVLSGLGTSLPPRVVTNDELAQRLDTSHDWIIERTGIARRRVAAPGTTTAALATAAGRAALASAGRSSCETVIVATTTPDRSCPATAPSVATALGLTGAAAFDVSAVCSGFVYALSVASSMIVAGLCGSVLVIGAELYSAIVDPDDRSTAIIFGDGAGAVLLERGERSAPGAVLHHDLGSDGEGRDLITVPPGERFLRMRGREVYVRAVPTMTASARRVAEAAGWRPGEIDGFVGHQANLRILQSVAKRLELPDERVIANIAEVGNTAAASIPLALASAAGQGRLARGDRLVLTAFGGGLTWGSTALLWSGARPVHQEVEPLS
ncbi:beta-ketoacyl-ACP synthase III [Streptomyces sp. NPDC088923]|uniref:beta-ketoacyl-ACP synthase III n=1 Tax=Streptomyces sp. NPDC088923 TaxID=3365913 RepID=UPI0038149583